MSATLKATFEKCKQEGKVAFIPFITAGYPTAEEFIPIILALQQGGADIIEVGVPFSDPLADGTTVQRASEHVLRNGMSLAKTFDLIQQAKSEGLTAPIVLMSYYNPLLAYGIERLIQKSVQVGIAGFIVVDLPPEEAEEFVTLSRANGVAFVPLAAPTSSDERLKILGKLADGYIYCVSVTGVTGQRQALPEDLPQFISRVRAHSSVPLAVGFGISKPEHVQDIARYADGAVVGSAIINKIDSAEAGTQAFMVKSFVQSLTEKTPALM
eukprot:GILJ01002471.1.p2 GENE.GILJ01002471.1~~GILJ01002471.1.p2  ORF type:complete len:269 (+),score=54.76 GILJ01002471.1:106-912(+)